MFDASFAFNHAEEQLVVAESFVAAKTYLSK